MTALFFYLFAALCVASAVMVIVAKNPVHAVLFLILAFFNAAGLFVLLGAEFLAMLLVIVYVGAVAVLFLFVVMMLDVDFAELRAGFIQNATLGAIIGGIVLVELIMVLGARALNTGLGGKLAAPIAAASDVSNTEAIGRLLYTKYVYFFQGAGLILLVAMIGAIVLTLRHKEGVRRQSIAAQVARNPATAMQIVKIGAGESVVPEARGKGMPEARGKGMPEARGRVSGEAGKPVVGGVIVMSNGRDDQDPKITSLDAARKAAAERARAKERAARPATKPQDGPSSTRERIIGFVLIALAVAAVIHFGRSLIMAGGNMVTGS